MPLWKHRQVTRLMKPIDGEGSDLGGGASAVETAMDAVGVSDKPCREHGGPVKAGGANDARRRCSGPWQAAVKPFPLCRKGEEMVGATGIEPVTPPV